MIKLNLFIKTYLAVFFISLLQIIFQILKYINTFNIIAIGRFNILTVICLNSLKIEL